MLLKKITLRNIRSYKEDTIIEIPEGTILFQGDIGCGKSTILSAIEFALFGLGDIDGNNLLRLGEKKGSVLLAFQVNNRNYQIFRSLLRHNKKVTQDWGYIVDEQIRTTYSVSEMKSKILKIININEKAQTRTTSVIYRFAIFTPQEMMKQILSELPEKRLEILRRAFNIEEYSTARRNAEIFLGWTNGEIRVSSEISKDLYEREALLQGLKQRVSLLAIEVEQGKAEISKLDKKIKELNAEIESLKPRQVLVLQLQVSIPHLNKTIERNQKALEKEQERVDLLKRDLGSINTNENILSQLKPVYEDYISKKDRLRQLEPSIKLLDVFDKEKTNLEQHIENERKNLESEIDRSMEERKTELENIEREEKSITELNTFEKEEVSLKGSVSHLITLREESDKILSLISENRTELLAQEEQMSKKQKEIESMIRMGEGARCPTCRQKLSIEHISKVKAEYYQEKLGIEEHVRYLNHTLTTYEHKLRENKSLIEDLESKDEHLRKLQRILGMLSEKKHSIENAKKTLQIKFSRLTEKQQNLSNENYSLEERMKLSQILKEMSGLTAEKELYRQVEQIVSKYEFEKIEHRYVEKLHEIKRKSKIEKEIQDNSKLIDSLQIEIDSNKQKLYENQILFEKNKNAIKDLEILEGTVDNFKNKTSEMRQNISGKCSELRLLESNLHEVENEVHTKRECYSNKQIFQQTNNWLEQHFIPAVQDIERHVLQSINEEFNQLFQRWFSILMETGDISVEADSNFTPIISQSGYSLSVNSLSGGEKTSVALAYRLALNTMLKKVAGMDNALLILDEPTDGFGKEQLFRLRQVLNELNSAQIVMVSHERELESFADKIYRVTKDGNQSRIEVVGYN
ncbi:MAG TPA: SMC family ATPase [Candidatus Bathyarchaeia archaeon]|nr:SMC family ATPase [Candidatus Bathyarchaeia archaeon]